ncbi:MAG: hypothetical protein AB7G18_14770 [Pyrinomonadaceae bacterium]
MLLLLFGVGSHGQEPPKAVLVDEHGELPCDDTLGRIDMYFAELSHNPGSSGLITISGPPDKKHRIAFRQAIIENHAKWRGFDTQRFKIITLNSTDALKLQFWRIPLGADEPKLSGIDTSYQILPSISPFMMGIETEIGDQICPEVDDLEIFGRFLIHNPSSRGIIVVRERTLAKARAKGSRLLRTFEREYGIPSSRLRIFPRKRSIPSDNFEPIVEYWYLP